MTIPKQLIFTLGLSCLVLLNGCSMQSHSEQPIASTIPPKTVDENNTQVQSSIGTSMYGDPNGIELADDLEDNHSEQQAEVIGPAQALAIDSKHYAMVYGVDHIEAMRRMLIQHDNQKQQEALRKEFGDRIVAMGLINEPEYGYLITLSGTGAPPPDRILYRPADTLSEHEIVAQAYKTARPDGITLNQSDIDNAMALIESPTRFIVKFEVNPNAKNLSETQKQIMYERSNGLRDRIPMIVGQSYRSDEGVYVIYVHQDDAKAAGFNKDKLQKIGEEVMQVPVRIEWQDGYTTLD